MRRTKIALQSPSLSLVALAWCLHAPLASVAHAQDSSPTDPAGDEIGQDSQSQPGEPAAPANDEPAVQTRSGITFINRKTEVETVEERPSLEFNVPLVSGTQVLGDVAVKVERDGSVLIGTDMLREQLALLLNEEGLRRFDTYSANRENIRPEPLSEAGIELAFNQNLLEVTIVQIDGTLRQTRDLIAQNTSSSREQLTLLEPENFSAYLNINTNLEYDTEEEEFRPEFFFDGATRIGDIVVEYDGAYSDQLGDGMRFSRRGVRAVYDQREKFRRFAAGDLRLESLSLLRTPFLGGVSVEKSRRVFDPFLPAARLGSGEIFLDNRSTVDVVINGEQFQRLELDAGTYDLASLPVQLGSNDVELRIRDSGGREQLVNLDYFFQPLDLEAGEEEYSFAAGFIARDLAFEPNYTDDPAVTALYRRGVSDNLVLGGAAQISEDVQLFGLESSIVPQFIPGFFDLQAATSFSEASGTGFAARASYRFTGGNSFTNRSGFTLNVDYTGEGFTTISNLIPVAFDLVTVSANYNRTLTERGRMVAGALYSHRSGPQDDLTNIFVDYIHRVSDRLQVTIGAEYGTGDAFGNEWGTRVAVSYVFGPSTRALADYRSRSETFRANLSKGSENRVGSFGYDVGVTTDPNQSRIDASFDYTSNRFDTRFSAFTAGDNFGSIDQEQRYRLQVGTSLAFAGKEFAIGRPVRDAFVIAHPHETLSDGEVITGRTLADNEYEANSGIFGGALQGRLSSYTEQTVQYDVEGGAVGYDIGEGSVRLDPPYRAGYSLEVGNDYFVSIVGNLYRGEEPVSLVSGTIVALDDDEFEEKQFFTNSTGRFGMIGFAPGKSYRVTYDNGASSFEFTVPEDSDGLFRLGDVRLPAIEE